MSRLQHSRLQYICLLCISLGFLLQAKCQVLRKQKLTFYADRVIRVKLPKQRSSKGKMLVGQPSPRTQAGAHALLLGDGARVVVRLGLPKKREYCISMRVHIPSDKANEGDYRLWIGATQDGPWHPVGSGNETKDFNIRGALADEARFVRIDDLTQNGEGVWLDAISVTIFRKGWLPASARPLPWKGAKAKAKAKELRKLGFRAYREQKFKDAIAHLATVVRIFPKDAKSHYKLAASYHVEKRYFHAHRFYQRALNLAEPGSVYLQDLGELYLTLKLPRLAARYFRSCIREAPLHPKCYYHLVHTASLQRNPKRITFRRDQYLIIRKRTNILRRHLSLKQFFQRYFRASTPIVDQYPAKFSYGEHLDWFGFLCGLFPNDFKTLRDRALKSIQKRIDVRKEKQPKLTLAFYRALLYRNAFKHQTSAFFLQKLYPKLKDPSLGYRFCLAYGDLLKRLKNRQEARKMYKTGLTRFARTKTQKARLQRRLSRL